MPAFSKRLEQSLHRTLAEANERRHEYATLEHLLLSLIDDTDASTLLGGCKVNTAALKKSLVDYIDSELVNLVTDGREDAKPTADFQRVIQRAVIHVQSSGREEVTGADVLSKILTESESHASHLLQKQGISLDDVDRHLGEGIVAKSNESEYDKQSEEHYQKFVSNKLNGDFSSSSFLQSVYPSVELGAFCYFNQPIFAGNYSIFIVNDNHTPFDFVHELLMRFFRKCEFEARAIALMVHKEGRTKLGDFSFPVCFWKMKEANDFIKKNSHPLLLELKSNITKDDDLHSDPVATCDMGVRKYFEGSDPHSVGEAVKLWEASAVGGCETAHFNLGIFHQFLGSGLIDHIQKITVAAMQIADMKVCAHRS